MKLRKFLCALLAAIFVAAIVDLTGDGQVDGADLGLLLGRRHVADQQRAEGRDQA